MEEKKLIEEQRRIAKLQEEIREARRTSQMFGLLAGLGFGVALAFVIFHPHPPLLAIVGGIVIGIIFVGLAIQYSSKESHLRREL